MGIVIDLDEIRRTKALKTTQPPADALDVERAVADAIARGGDHADVMAAARPLLERCRDRYGFVVMRDGLPTQPVVLARALVALAHGLTMLDAGMGAPRTYPTFGVYFGRAKLAWFEDGYSGATGLAVPDDVRAADLAQFVRPRVTAGRMRSQE